MFYLNDLDVNLNFNHKIHTLDIDDNDMDNDIVKVIDEQSDYRKDSNVKAKRTGWYMQDQKGFSKLGDIFKVGVETLVKKKNNCTVNAELQELWGIKYLSNEVSHTHDHFPFTYSMAYYINPPKNSPNLYFPQLDYTHQIKHGQMVIFDGWLKHMVSEKSFEGIRYAVSGNISANLIKNNKYYIS